MKTEEVGLARVYFQYYEGEKYQKLPRTLL